MGMGKMKEPKRVSPDSPASENSQPGGEHPMRTPMSPRKHDARLSREVQARIGQQLRAFYDDVVNQGVPDHIADLVRRMSEQDDEGSH
jgi:hypothetical protein